MKYIELFKMIYSIFGKMISIYTNYKNNKKKVDINDAIETKDKDKLKDIINTGINRGR